MNGERLSQGNKDETGPEVSQTDPSLLKPKERVDLAKLCWLLNDAGTQALRITFNNIHPPISLKEHLAHYHVKAVLQRLLESRVLNQKQWSLLYPQGNRQSTSQHFDSKLLSILLETICHMSPPYPGGWDTWPLQIDKSMSADLVRLQKKFIQIGSLSGVRNEEFPVLWEQVTDVLERLGGHYVKVQIQRIENESIPGEMVDHYIRLVKELWSYGHDKSIRRLRLLYGTANKSKIATITAVESKTKADETEGLSLEDKTVLTRMSKFLADNIIAEDILDRLQQGQLIKIADRQEIMSHAKNADQVSLIVEKIQNSKLSYGLKLLCDALKFKYPTVYDALMKCRKTVYKQGVKETIDLVKVCQDVLTTEYKNVYSNYSPVPWIESMCIEVYDYYIPLDIIDQQGNKVPLSDMLPAKNTVGHGKKVILEGMSGSGKSILAAVLASLWANDKNFFNHKYDFFLLIDAEVLEEDFLKSVYKMLLHDNGKLSLKEFWSVLEDNARNVMIIIDGFDDRTDCQELIEIMNGTRLRKSTVMVLVTPEMHVRKFLTPDYMLFNTGLDEDNMMHFVTLYSKLLHFNPDRFEAFKEYLKKKDWPLLIHLSSPFICLMLLLVYHTNKHINLLSLNTLTSLCEQFFYVMSQNVCKKLSLAFIGNEFPTAVNDIMLDLEKKAFSTLILNKPPVIEGETYRRLSGVSLSRHAISSRNIAKSKFKFICSVMTDFLAARHIADMTFEDMLRTIRENKFLKKSRYAQLVGFICGIYGQDTETPTLGLLFRELVSGCYQTHFKASMKEEESEEYSVKTLSEPTSAHILNYSHILHGVSECSGKYIASNIAGTTVAQVIFVRREGLFHTNTILGMSHLFQSQICNVTHLEINLLPVYLYQTQVYTRFGEALGANEFLAHLRIYWWSLAVLAKFLKVLMYNAKSLETLHIEDCTKAPLTKIAAATWDDLRDVCENLRHLKKFMFHNCKTAAVICHVFQKIPNTIQELDFTGSPFNLMCASEVAAYLEKSSSLRLLNLSNTKLQSSGLNALAQGIKLSNSIQELNISRIDLDKVGIAAIAESIKLSTSLVTLDLSHSELTFYMCQKLADAILHCRSMKKLILVSSKVSSHGRAAISSITHRKVNQLKVVGL